MKKFTLAMSMSLLMSSAAIATPPFTVDTDERGAARKLPTFHRSLNKRFEPDFKKALSMAQVWTNETPLLTMYQKAIAANPPKKYTKHGLYEKAISENTEDGVETQGILIAPIEEWDSKLDEAYTAHPVARKAIADHTTESKLLELQEEWNAKVAQVLSAPSDEWNAKLAEAYESDKGAQTVLRLTEEGRVQLEESRSQWETYLANLRDRQPVSVSLVDESTIKFEPVKAVIQGALSEAGPYDRYVREAIYRALTIDTESKPFMTVLSEDAFDTTTYTFKTSLPEDTRSLLLGGEGLLIGKTQTELFGETTLDARRIPAVTEDVADNTTVSINTNPLANADFVVSSYTKMLEGLEEESLTQITDATLSRLYEDGAALVAIHRALKPHGFVEFCTVGGKDVMNTQMQAAGFTFVREDDAIVRFEKLPPYIIQTDIEQEYDATTFASINPHIWRLAISSGAAVSGSKEFLRDLRSFSSRYKRDHATDLEKSRAFDTAIYLDTVPEAKAYALKFIEEGGEITQEFLHAKAGIFFRNKDLTGRDPKEW